MLHVLVFLRSRSVKLNRLFLNSYNIMFYVFPKDYFKRVTDFLYTKQIVASFYLQIPFSVDFSCVGKPFEDKLKRKKLT